jgi:hypothetical protein
MTRHSHRGHSTRRSSTLPSTSATCPQTVPLAMPCGDTLALRSVGAPAGAANREAKVDLLAQTRIRRATTASLTALPIRYSYSSSAAAALFLPGRACRRESGRWTVSAGFPALKTCASTPRHVWLIGAAAAGRPGQMPQRQPAGVAVITGQQPRCAARQRPSRRRPQRPSLRHSTTRGDQLALGAGPVRVVTYESGGARLALEPS